MRFTDAGTLINPGQPTRNGRTGNVVPGPPVEVAIDGVLQPLSTSEAADGSLTVLAGWRLLLPPGTPVTARSRWKAPDGRLFEVQGDPQPLSTGAGLPSHISVSLNLVSDLQEAP